MNQLTHIIDEGAVLFDKKFVEHCSDGDILGKDVPNEVSKAKSFLASRQLALLRGLEEEVRSMEKPIIKEDRIGASMINIEHINFNYSLSSVLAKIQEAIKHLEKKI